MSNPQARISIAVSPSKVRNVLLMIAVALTVAGALTQLYVYLLADEALERNYVFRHYYLVTDSRGELSFSDWFSTLGLFASALLVAVGAAITRARRGPYLVHWIVLALILLFLSADESMALHSRASDSIQDALGPTGLVEPWLIPAAALALVYGLAYVRFVIDLPQQIRRLVVLAAVLFVAGAMGFELIEGFLLEEAEVSQNSLGYALVATGEQLMEMLAVVILIYALLLYLSFVEESVGVKFAK